MLYLGKKGLTVLISAANKDGGPEASRNHKPPARASARKPWPAHDDLRVRGDRAKE